MATIKMEKTLEHFRNGILDYAGVEMPTDEKGKDALDTLAKLLQRLDFDPFEMDIQPLLKYAAWEHEEGDLAQAWDGFTIDVM